MRVLQEGQLTNTIFKNRFDRRKNILLGVTGPTGSGKSYTCLRMAELWYLYRFNKPFPIENVTFSNAETMKLISSGRLDKGELIIMEETGVNFSSLDFQSKVGKMMNYIMQSFRSMNIGLLLNLPVLSMLNKSGRLLLHGHFITQSIDFNTKEVKLKPLMHQLNQQSGKSYWKYPRAIVNHKMLAIQYLCFGLPSKGLIDAYEKKKFKFLSELTIEYSQEFDKIELNKLKAMARTNLAPGQLEVYNMLQEGLSVKDIAKKRGTCVQSVYDIIELIKNKGYKAEKSSKSLENVDFKAKNLNQPPF